MKKSHPSSSAIYHTPTGKSKKQPARNIHFPAFPEIDDPYNPCCSPFLWRAIYTPDLSFLIKLEDAAELTEAYISHLKISTPEIRQQVLNMVKAHHSSLKSSGWAGVDILSPSEEYGQNRQLPTDALNFRIDLLKTWLGGSMIQSTQNVPSQAFFQALIHGYLRNFPGSDDGDFTAVFSFLHEMVHYMAKASYSAMIQEQWAINTHKTLEILMNYSLSPEEISEHWTRFWESNNQLISSAHKFEPIEESFATYLGLYFLPSELRDQFETSLINDLKEKHWSNAYNAFVEICDKFLCFYSPMIAALIVFEKVSQILTQVNIDSTKLLCAYAKIRKALRPYIE
jgi:hypothetical protein